MSVPTDGHTQYARPVYEMHSYVFWKYYQLNYVTLVVIPLFISLRLQDFSLYINTAEADCLKVKVIYFIMYVK